MNEVYCLYGLDQKRIIEKRNSIISEKMVDEFNTSFFDMESTSLETAVSDSMQVPFLSDYRIVVMKNCNFLTSQKNKGESEDGSSGIITSFGLDELKKYLLNPSPTTILIMEVIAEKLDSKKEIVKIIKDKKYDIEIRPISKEEISANIIKFLKENELSCETKAKEELVKRLEGDSMSFDNEVEKLSLYYKKGDKITYDVVKNLITESNDENIFSLMNAIMEKDKKRALDTYYSLLHEGNDPLYIQGFIVKRFMQLLYVKEIEYQSGTQQDVISLLKVSSGQAYYLMNDAKKVSYKKLSKIINDLKELDYSAKSSFKYGSDLTLGFELFLTKI